MNIEFVNRDGDVIKRQEHATVQPMLGMRLRMQADGDTGMRPYQVIGLVYFPGGSEMLEVRVDKD
ncbi:hypothetical protein LCGC14_0570200 [marine sediment metagenome]|uniref:Uncharacterized protein n=1 Tax=marine sediment metagenome TaxID=412755 RepID=A0A0F9UST8_9ZZZZ